MVGWVAKPSSRRVDGSILNEGAIDASMLQAFSNGGNDITTSDWSRPAHRFGRHINKLNQKPIKKDISKQGQ
jgi:hypothetical protein